MLSLFFLLLSIYSGQQFLASSCGYGDIDLTYLASPIDYTTSGFTTSKYYMNICGTVNYPQCRNAFPSTTLCQIDNNTIHNLAVWDSRASPMWSYINNSNPNVGVRALYSNGENCKYNQSYMVDINYLCRESTSPRFKIYKDGDCVYRLEQEVNCHPKPLYPSQGLSNTVIFFIILLSCMLPLSCAAFINQYRRCKRLRNVNWKASCGGCWEDLTDKLCCRRYRISYTPVEKNSEYHQI